MSFRIKAALVLGFAVMSFGIGYGYVADAFPGAGLWGRGEYRGFFGGTYDDRGTYVWPTSGGPTGCKASGGNAMPTSVTTAPQLIAFVHCKYNNGTTQEKRGAAFIVQTIAHPMSAPVYDNTPSATDWQRFEDALNLAASQGRIRAPFDMPYTYNSYYQGTGLGSNPADDAFYDDSNTMSTFSIINSSSKVIYSIKYFCGNPVGNSNFDPPPQPPNYIVQGYTTPSVPAGSTAAPGTTVSFKHYLRNVGTTNVTGVGWVTQNTETVPISQTYSGGTGSTVMVAGNATGIMVKDELVPIPPTAVAGSQVCRRVGAAPTEWDKTAYTYFTKACITVGFNPGASCGGLTINPGAFGPTDNYTLTAVVTETGGAPAAQAVHDSGNFYINITGPSFTDNNSGLASTVGTSGSNGTLTATFSPGATNKAGAFTVHYGITGPIGDIDCSDTFTVAYTPYFSVRGGDVAAGPGFGTACTPKLSDIRGKNLGSGSTYFGAGTELAALSLGTITGFATNTTLNYGTGLGGSTTGLAAMQPSGLAFANTGVGGATWGTTYGKDPAEDPGNSSWCVPDYYGSAMSGDTEPLGSNTLTQTLISSGLANGKVYTTSGTTTIDGPILTLNGGVKRLTLVVENGDVIINGDITYGGYSYNSASSSIDIIPQFQLLVKGGNIYVDEGVTKLTGFYHAQRSGSAGGTIYTCSSGGKYLTDDASSPANALYAANYYDRCKTDLTIYGSVAADSVKLLRTRGNWKTVPSISNRPAEQVIYNPELWMGSLSSSSGGVGPFDSITSLPPIF